MTDEAPTATTPPLSNSGSRTKGSTLSAIPKFNDRGNLQSSKTGGGASTEQTNSTPPSEDTNSGNIPKVNPRNEMGQMNEHARTTGGALDENSIEAAQESRNLEAAQKSRNLEASQESRKIESKKQGEKISQVLQQQEEKVKQQALEKQQQDVQGQEKEKQEVPEKENVEHIRKVTEHGDASTETSNNSPASTVSDSSTVSSTSATSDTLDFAKRDISKCASRHSYSQLSSLTVNSPGHNIEPLTTITDEPVLQADDHERIRNPASAAFQRMPEGEQIGFREPFGDSSNANSRNGSSASSPDVPHSPTGGVSGGSNVTSPHIKASATRISPHTVPPFVPSRKKPYEPARVVLHKSEFNAPYGAPSSTNAAPSQTNSSAYPGYIDASRRSSSVVSDMPLVPHSLVLSLAGSPDDINNNGPLKQIREPKQPIYIPAVLRPTEEASYESDSPNGGSSGRTSISTASLASSAWAVLHSKKPVTRHWVRDESASQCGACERNFTWYRRKHHCRKCGGIFCATDTSRTIGLDRILNFNVLGVPCRACDKCASEFASFCLDSPRLSDGPLAMQQPLQGPEQEEIEAGGGGDWSTF